MSGQERDDLMDVAVAAGVAPHGAGPSLSDFSIEQVLVEWSRAAAAVDPWLAPGPVITDLDERAVRAFFEAGVVDPREDGAP